MEVLCTKHPDARPPYVANLDTYLDQPTDLVPVEITEDMVTEVSGRLSRGAGPGGGGLSEPTTLDPKVWKGNWRVVDDGRIICGLASKRSPPLGHLRCVDEWTADCTEYTARGQASWGEIKLVPLHIEVRPEGDGAVGQGGLWD